jgi:hypothetical protein
MPNYDRFWELHITGTNGYYDFAPSINDQRTYQTAQHAAQLPASCMLVTPTNLVAPGIITGLPSPPQGLPNQGYVASALTIQDMATPVVSHQFQELVAWINDAGHLGKMRVNAHGDGMGQIGMSDGVAPLPVHYRDAASLVAWMVANGLAPAGGPTVRSLAGSKQSRGLVTLNLAVCMGGRYDVTPASLNLWQTNSSPALNSAADRIARAFGQNRLSGIEITASNEITMDGASGVAGQWGRTFGLGANQTPSMRPSVGLSRPFDIQRNPQGVRIMVPDGWTVTANFIGVGGSIEPPAGFNTWTMNGATPSAGCTITNAQGDAVDVPPGWIADRTNHKIVPPLGFRCKSNGNGRGGYLESIADNAVHRHGSTHGAFGYQDPRDFLRARRFRNHAESALRRGQGLSRWKVARPYEPCPRGVKMRGALAVMRWRVLDKGIGARRGWSRTLERSREASADRARCSGANPIRVASDVSLAAGSSRSF